MIQTRPHIETRTYYWITFFRNGRAVVLGPEDTEDNAYSRGFLSQEANFEVVALRTRDKARATSMLKARMLDRTQDIDGALRRVSHQDRE